MTVYCGTIGGMLDRLFDRELASCVVSPLLFSIYINEMAYKNSDLTLKGPEGQIHFKLLTID